MWKPNDVVTEHKKRATMVWIGLLIAIVGFVVWQIVTLVDKYENPSTSFEVSDDVFRFPYTEVCLGGGHGCDWEGCVESVNATIFDPCESEWKVQIPSPPESDGCVTFDLGSMETEGFEDRECIDKTERPFIHLEMFWIANNDTADEDDYNSGVAVFLGGVEVQALTWVPYTRIVLSEEESASEVRITQTDMTIGMSVRAYLSGDSITSYPTLTISSTEHVIRNQAVAYDELHYRGLLESNSSGGEDLSFGYLSLSLTLGPFSFTKLSDDDPIDMLDFIANIGGFWEILLLAWGVFFIATRDSAPKQKARNFANPIQKGKRPAILHKPSTPEVGSDTECADEQQPSWSTTHRGPRRATDFNNGGALSATCKTARSESSMQSVPV